MSTEPVNKRGMTLRQLQYLRERLSDIRRSKPSNYEPITRTKEPREVRLAKAQIAKLSDLVQQWEDGFEELRDKRNEAIAKDVAECRRLIEFGNAQEALKALDAFQAKKY